jgi:hypothetical protein
MISRITTVVMGRGLRAVRALGERSMLRCIALLSIALVAACSDAHSPTSPPPPPPPPVYEGFPGFDISHYPGDAALTAWRHPASPYHWVGYYLYAPCHRDSTWMGSYAKVKTMGWGTAVLYVGQQDWSMIPSAILRARRSVASPDLDRDMTSAAYAASAAATTVTCSASLLTSEQGTSEAADAVAKTAGEGVPEGSAIFLDVEYVSSVSPELLTYVSAWITGVLEDGRYRPAIYCAKANADAIYTAAMAAYASAGREDAPRFWIASTREFAITDKPTDVGLEYANVWQGKLDVSETWAGLTYRIDVNVADSPSPSESE